MLVDDFFELAINYLPLMIPVVFVMSMVVAYIIYCIREEIEYRNYED